MLKTVGSLLILGVALQVSAQHSIVLLSQENYQPVSGAFVQQFFDSPARVKTFISNEKGGINIENDDAAVLSRLKIIAVGFNTYMDTLIALEVDTLFLVPNTLLDEICVTTQYQPTGASEAIQKINVITAEQIRLSGSVTLSDILQYQAGLRVSQDHILGSAVNIGGISGENVKILIDGVPLIGRLNGNIDLSQINLNNIERIELVEGPLSVNYGTNALGGTINLITKKQIENGVYLEINPYYENTGHYNLNGSAGLQLAKSEITLSGGRNYFDGWSSIDSFFEFPKEKPADTNRFIPWKPKEQYYAEVQYRVNVAGWKISPYVRYFDEKIINRGFPKAPYFETAVDDYYYTWRKDAGITVDRTFKKGRLNFIGAYNNFERIKNTYFIDLTTLHHTLSETTGAQDTARFALANVRSTYNSNVLSKFNYEIGFDLNHESAYGARIEGIERTMGDYAAFTTAQWEPLKNLMIKPGLRYAFNTIYKAPLIPSVRLRYKRKNLTWRASVARGFRAPSLKELYFDFVDINHNIHGNVDLLAERAMNYSLSVSWMKQSDNNRLYKIDIGTYYNDIKNLITLGLDGNNSYTYLNIGEYRTIGSQASFSLRCKKINLQLNAAYIGRYNAASDESDLKMYLFSPEVSTQFSWLLWKEYLALNIFYKYNGPLQTFYIGDDDEIVTNVQQDYHVLDASIGIKALKNKLKITLGAKNLLNVKTVMVSGQSGEVHAGGSGLNMARGICVFINMNYQLNFSLKRDDK